MALQKDAVPINFASGLDLKTDPKQIALGKFLRLVNTVFSKANLMQKRNGYGQLASLPNSSNTFLTTYNGNLTAVGNTLNAYNSGAKRWVSKGSITPVQLSTLSLIRSNSNQTYADSAISSNDLVCTVYKDDQTAGTVYRYAIADSITGQNIVAPTAIPSAGTVTYTPKVFLLGNYFVIVYLSVISGVNHLQYVAINSNNPTAISSPSDISTNYTPASTGTFDGTVANNNLYISWIGADGGGAVRMTYIDSTLVQHSTVVFTGHTGTHISVCADTSGGTAVVYTSYYDSSAQTGYIFAVNQQLSTILAQTQWAASLDIKNVTASADSGIATIFYELNGAYSYDSSIKTHLVRKRTCTQAGTLGTATTVARGVGLASKAFLVNDTAYFLAIYNSAFQPTYFVINSSGAVVAKLAYSNASSYYVTGLPSVNVSGQIASVAYPIKDQIQAVNKTQGVANTAGIYTQLGLNLAFFNFETDGLDSAEIGNDLHLSGGFMWMYDGYVPVEHSFHLWPDYVEVSTSGAGGLITAQQYFYAVTYEWSDNQGNIHRSAPSIPVSITTTGATSTNTVNIPTLRLTYKTANPVKIVVYRWSAAQQTYYQVTSLTAPLMNDTTADSVAFTDTFADSAIIGNNILYTTGGVLENIAAPAISSMALSKSRLFAVDAEDENVVWYSKQVIEGVPVEMSDLLTLYVPPTTGSQFNTGGVKVVYAMDDKTIFFKKGAISYMTGIGPDNTGANNDFSDPVFITSTVGCDNPNSIVFMPNGLMFQSDKGIWLLGRDLNTSYIGAPVEDFTTSGRVKSAVTVPGTNQVRFTLDSGVTLMYDYYYGQWGVFMNVSAVSSCIYQDLHTFINSRGEAYQETPGAYLDGSRPVLMGFTTGWINLAGLQGYERAYYFYLLGTYLSPHKLHIQIAYDYNSSPSQSNVITPDNSSPAYGGDSLWGGGNAWGGSTDVEQWRVFLQTQKCQAFQIIMDEIYDSSLGVAAGAGLTLSGLDLVIGRKSGYPRIKSSRSVG